MASRQHRGGVVGVHDRDGLALAGLAGAAHPVGAADLLRRVAADVPRLVRAVGGGHAGGDLLAVVAGARPGHPVVRPGRRQLGLDRALRGVQAGHREDVSRDRGGGGGRRFRRPGRLPAGGPERAERHPECLAGGGDGAADPDVGARRGAGLDGGDGQPGRRQPGPHGGDLRGRGGEPGRHLARRQVMLVAGALRVRDGSDEAGQSGRVIGRQVHLRLDGAAGDGRAAEALRRHRPGRVGVGDRPSRAGRLRGSGGCEAAERHRSGGYRGTDHTQTCDVRHAHSFLGD